MPNSWVTASSGFMPAGYPGLQSHKGTAGLADLILRGRAIVHRQRERRLRIAAGGEDSECFLPVF